MNEQEENENEKEMEMDFMEKIPLYFLFVDINNYLIRVEKEIYEFPEIKEEEQIVPFSYMICAVKKWGGNRYKLMDTLLFETSDLEEENLNDFMEETNFKKIVLKHFKVLPFLNDVSFSPSLIMMQSLHGIYFVLKEKNVKSNLKPQLNFLEMENDTFIETKDFELKMGTTRKNNNLLKIKTTRRRRR